MTNKAALLAQQRVHTNALKSIVDRIDAEHRNLTAAEQLQAKDLMTKATALMPQIRQADRDEVVMANAMRLIGGGGIASPYSNLVKSPGRWAATVADRLVKVAGQTGVKSLTSGSIDVPAPLAGPITTLPDRPRRITDLLLDRETITGAAYSYSRQTAKINNAAPVANGASKPVSVFTVEEIEDRVRVVATISEPVPERLLSDHVDMIDFLNGQMYEAVLSAVEAQVLSGNGLGENFQGLLSLSGTLAVPFSSDVLTTLRKARTAMEMVDEQPNAWLLSPTDAETVDLLRETGTAGQFLTGAGRATSNVFGDLPVVVSPQLTTGVAILGDWRYARLIVREDARIDFDRSGELFTKNLVVARTEGRWGLAWKRPRAFAVIDLTA